MGARHPLPYAYAKAHTLLLEDDGERLVLWAPETVALPALSEVLRLYDVDALEREAASSLANRIMPINESPVLPPLRQLPGSALQPNALPPQPDAAPASAAAN